MSNNRKRRAAPIDLYKSCQMGGDCFPDVQNKIEGTTLADRLLQIFSSVLYFGGLGIGSGKGTGGSTGYKPLTPGATQRPSQFPQTFRPTIPIDPLGGADVIPLDIIDASTPSVVPLTDGVPETTIISSGTGPTVDIGDLDVTTTVDISATSVARGDHPAIIDISEEGSSVIDVQNGPPPPKKLQLDTLLNPPETIDLVIPPTTTYRDSNINVFVDTHISGEVIGAESIPLEELSTIEQFEIEEPRQTSTPVAKLNKAMYKAKTLYNRFVKQVPTPDLHTLLQPSRQVTFEFDNPAFSDDVSFEFINDLQEVTAALNPDFQDIQTLSRPIISETESGSIRYSRIGQRASMQTRSGLVIGEKVHFYYDLSTIEPADSVELSTFVNTSADAIVQNEQIESVFIDEVSALMPDEELLDSAAESFRNSHLVFSFTTEEAETVTLPILPSNFSLQTYIPDQFKKIFVSYPISGSDVAPYLPSIPISPLYPSEVTVYGDSFVIDPFFLKRKRKRYTLY